MKNHASHLLELELNDLLVRARTGSRDDLGQLLQHFRLYLLQIASDELASDLRVKAAPSDLVQESLLEAARAFPKFDGVSRESFAAWLRAILRNNLHDLRDRYGADKRQLRRERPAAALGADHELPADHSSPSETAIRKEHVERLTAALAALPAEARVFIELRHLHGRSFGEIAAQFNINEAAARHRWTLAVAALKDLMREKPSEKQQVALAY